MAATTLTFLVLIPIVAGQSRQIPSLSREENILGLCSHDLQQDPTPLGRRDVLGSEGLVAQNLLEVSRQKSPDSPFHSRVLPRILINGAKITCKSEHVYPFLRLYRSVSVLVDYNCRGVSCGQRETEIMTIRYKQLFSFACLRKDNVWGLYSQLSEISDAYVDRFVENELGVSTVVAQASSCVLCRVLSPSQRNLERYEAATGCISESFLVKKLRGYYMPLQDVEMHAAQVVLHTYCFQKLKQ